MSASLARDRALVLAVALAAGSLVVTLLTTRGIAWVPPDAANYGIVARSLLAGEGFTENVVPFHPAPFAEVRHVPEPHAFLQPFVLAPLMALLGESPAVLRAPGLAYAALSGVVVFLWGRRLFGTAAGVVACLLTVTSATLQFVGMLGTDDAGFAFFLVATLAALDRALETRSDHHFLLAGVLAALTLLQKAAGITLAGVLIAVPFFPRRPRLRAVVLLWAPFAAALGLYLLRNHLAHGSVGFRISPLDWHLRAGGFEGMMQLFEKPPELVETLRRLGAPRVQQLIAHEVRALGAAVLPSPPWILSNPALKLASPSFLPLLGLLAIPLLARRYARPAALTMLALVSATLLLCVLWHVELRFLSFLVPLLALWTSGLLAAAVRLTGQVWKGQARAVAAAALGTLVVAPGVWSFVVEQQTFVRYPDLSHCRPALAWLDEHAAPEDRLLSFDPWFASWHIGRDAIMIPTGGPGELAVVARRYDAHWLLAWDMFGRPRTSRTVMGLGASADGIAVSTTYQDARCRVYRLDW